MKIVKILGGLGNQMFQYALFLSLKERFSHEQVMIDTSCFRNYPLHNGFEVDRIFAQKAPVASWRNILKVAYPYPNYRFWKIGKYILPKRKTMCVERKNFSFDAAVLTRKGDCYYDGYWQLEYDTSSLLLKPLSTYRIHITNKAVVGYQYQDRK